MYLVWNGPLNSLYVDLQGNPVERTPLTNPYNYDTFVVWKSRDFNLADYFAQVHEKEPTTGVADDDRMRAWDRDAYSRAVAAAWPKKPHGAGFYEKKPEDISKFLSVYYGAEIKLTALLQSCNQSNGYPYWTFYYKFEKEK